MAGPVIVWQYGVFRSPPPTIYRAVSEPERTSMELVQFSPVYPSYSLRNSEASIISVNHLYKHHLSPLGVPDYEDCGIMS